MFSQFFGNYLLTRGRISPEELREVLALQDAVRVKLGILAIDAGYMTAEQVERVHGLQAIRDKRFGEIAIEEGFLDEERLSELLSGQNRRHLLISQALVDRGVLGFEEVERLLADYRRDSGLSEDEYEALKSNDIDAVARALVRMPELGESGVYADYFALFTRNMVRFIDSGVFFGLAERAVETTCERFIHQEMEGRFKLFTGFSGPAAAMAEFAARFAKMSGPLDEELIGDALGEFMNVQNGLFLSKLSNEWVELELGTPEYRGAGRLRTVGAAYSVPFSLSFGRFVFYVGLGSPIIEH